MLSDSTAGPGRQITVNSRKYDGRIRRSWTGGLVTETKEHIVLVGGFDRDVEHSDLGRIRQGTTSFEYFWLHRWYNIFRFHEPDGALRGYYCNITMPPTFQGDIVDYVDLDIDVLVWPDKQFEIVDLDDFERNTERFAYSDDVCVAARSAVEELTALIARNGLP
jgi:uncharacterized protein